MKLLRKVLRMFSFFQELTLFKIIVTAIVVSVVALIYLSFVASLLVFHHWSVTTMECLLLVCVTLEIKMCWLLRKNSVKLLRMFDYIEIYQHIHHYNYYHQEGSKLYLSSLCFLASSFMFVSIQIYSSTQNELIRNIFSAGNILPLFYVNVIITSLFSSTIFMISLFVCFQMRLTFYNIYIDKYNKGSFHLFFNKDLRKLIESLNNFYVSNKFSFISYIEPLEKLNTMFLLCNNLYLSFFIFSIYNFNCNIVEIFLITIWIIIMNSYYICNYFIVNRKRRITKFISNCIFSKKMFIENSSKIKN